MRLNTKLPSNITVASSADPETGSPRTKVAYTFQGLQLEDDRAVSKLDLQRANFPRLGPRNEGMQEESAVSKRAKVFGDKESDIASGKEREIPETPQHQGFGIVSGSERNSDSTVSEKGYSLLRNEVDPMVFKGSSIGKRKGGLARAYPSINRLADSKSRASRKRMGTPPLLGSREASLETGTAEGGERNVDPDRAALTWHDDEITGHNPDDPDDDGEGINGIGFKPTPAIAYARSEKRRLQMAEYRSREAREARAKRSERRRGEVSKESSKVEAETARRVRFLEGMTESIIPTS
jgi:hypothetical protein